MFLCLHQLPTTTAVRRCGLATTHFDIMLQAYASHTSDEGVGAGSGPRSAMKTIGNRFSHWKKHFHISKFLTGIRTRGLIVFSLVHFYQGHRENCEAPVKKFDLPPKNFLSFLGPNFISRLQYRARNFCNSTLFGLKMVSEKTFLLSEFFPAKFFFLFRKISLFQNTRKNFGGKKINWTKKVGPQLMT